MEKIRQRLVLEGLEPELITPVLDGATTSTDSPSTPTWPPSPLQRSISARYEKMARILLLSVVNNLLL